MTAATAQAVPFVRPRFRVEGKPTGPQVDCSYVEDFTLLHTVPEVQARVREMHRRGLWVEVFSKVSEELIAGPYDPDEALRAVVLMAARAGRQRHDRRYLQLHDVQDRPARGLSARTQKRAVSHRQRWRSDSPGPGVRW
ncbi:hypothetical protein ACSFA0_24980 [Variovorax sp. LT1P1]|uniref:hypothetical protein n=1 Tax=Variovorax sp. LT1P1 TaxID=3443730 RepID=UPI003F47BF07